MGNVLFANPYGLGVSLQIVIAVRQSKPALIHLGDYLRRVLIVLIGAKAE